MDYILLKILSWALVLTPPLYALWAGRRLVSRLEDPAFPELRFAQGQRTLLVSVSCLVVALVLSVELGWLKGGVVLIGTLAARFPARRRIFEEAWGLWGYLSHMLRFSIALFGPWLLLALAPVLILAAEDWGLGVGVGLAVITVAWSHFNAQVFPLLTGAEALRRPELEAGFESVVNRARASEPRVLVAEARGGHWVNAFALPSAHRPAVLFTEGALRLMSPEEAAAIFAHEVAHLEHYTPLRLLARDVIGVVMFTVLLWLLGTRGVGSPVHSALTWAWPLAVIALLLLAAARNQAREHDSDRRAVELTGDPRSVITSLTKIHTAMRMPRRWGKNERKGSHPSLARRIRAIREAATELGLEVDPEGEGEEVGPGARAVETHVLRAAKGEDAVVLGEDRIHWLWGVRSDDDANAEVLLETARESRSIRYEALRDLRVDVAGIDGRLLVLVDEGGEESKLMLRHEDVPRAKLAVQRVEGRLAGTAPGQASESESGSRRASRVAAAFGLVFGLLPPFSLPLAVSSGVALARPARVTLTAAGAIGVAAALLGWRGARSGFFDPDRMLLVLGPQALVGCLLLYHAHTRVRHRLRDPAGAARLTLLALGVLALLYLLAGAITATSELPLTQLHLAARHGYGLTAVFLGGGAALFALGRQRAQLVALAAFVVGGLLTLAGSEWVRDRLGEDALLRRLETLPMARASLQPLRELTVPGGVTDLRVAPGGGRVAARVYSEDPLPAWREYRYGYVLETGAGQRFVPAIDAAFVTEDEIAVLEYTRDDRMAVRRLALASDTATLERWPLPYMDEANLAVSPTSRRWEVRALPHGHNSGRLIWGRLDEPEVRELEVRVEREIAYVRDIAVSADHGSVAVMATVQPPRLTYLSAFGLGLGSSLLSEIIAISEAGEVSLGRTTLDAWCLPPTATGAFTCVAHDNEGLSLLYAAEPEAHRLRPLGAVPGFYHTGRRLRSGALVLRGYAGGPVWIDPSVSRAVVLDVSPEESYYGTYAVGEDVVARALPNGAESRIEIYGWER